MPLPIAPQGTSRLPKRPNLADAGRLGVPLPRHASRRHFRCRVPICLKATVQDHAPDQGPTRVEPSTLRLHRTRPLPRAFQPTHLSPASLSTAEDPPDGATKAAPRVQRRPTVSPQSTRSCLLLRCRCALNPPNLAAFISLWCIHWT